MGNLTIFMAIFNSYVELPEDILNIISHVTCHMSVKISGNYLIQYRIETSASKVERGEMGAWCPQNKPSLGSPHNPMGSHRIPIAKHSSLAARAAALAALAPHRDLQVKPVAPPVGWICWDASMVGTRQVSHENRTGLEEIITLRPWSNGSGNQEQLWNPKISGGKKDPAPWLIWKVGKIWKTKHDLQVHENSWDLRSR